MKKISLSLLAALVGSLGLTNARALGPDSFPAVEPRGLAEAPLYFEANHGQTDSDARFIARGKDCTVFLSPTAATLRVSHAGKMRNVRLTLVGASAHAEISGIDELPGRANYFIGASAAQWQTGVPLFARVQLAQVYPGIDVVYYPDRAARLEYDFLLQPGADPRQIALNITGADRVRLDAAGNLVVKIGGEEIREHQPVIYQTVNGVRREIRGGYRLTGRTTAGFWLGEYDRALPLVIDPVLSFSSYLGGKRGDNGWDITTDPNGNVYVCGDTFSTDLRTNVTSGAFRTNYAGTQGSAQYGDAFVAKFLPTPSNTLTLAYLTYLGGKGQESARGIAADAEGNAYVTGFTDSPNFPVTTNAAFAKISGRNNTALGTYRVDAFVTKLGPAGTNLVYSTYLGGGERDAGNAIAIHDGNAFVTGFTESTNFPVVTNLLGGATRVVQNRFGGVRDIFVTEVGPMGTNLVYSTYLGGTNQESAYSIAVDNAGRAYLTGYTLSTNFPTVSNNHSLLNGQTNRTGFYDAFFTEISTNGDFISFSTYLGGEHSDVGLRLALDQANEGDSAYITGYTFSTNFPVSKVITNTRTWTNPQTNGFADIFVTKFVRASPGGAFPTNNFAYSVVFGGRTTDQPAGLAVDASGNAILTGFTSSTNLFNIYVATNYFTFTTNLGVIKTNHIFLTNYDTGANILDASSRTAKKTKSNTNNVFVAVLNADASAFTYAALFGGNGNDVAHGLALDLSRTNLYLVGVTSSTNFPSVSALQARSANPLNTNDVFILSINLAANFPALQRRTVVHAPGPDLLITQANGHVTLVWPDTQPVLTLESSPQLVPADWQPVLAVPSLLDGSRSVTLPATNPSGYFRLREAALPSLSTPQKE